MASVAHSGKHSHHIEKWIGVDLADTCFFVNELLIYWFVGHISEVVAVCALYKHPWHLSRFCIVAQPSSIYPATCCKMNQHQANNQSPSSLNDCFFESSFFLVQSEQPKPQRNYYLPQSKYPQHVKAIYPEQFPHWDVAATHHAYQKGREDRQHINEEKWTEIAPCNLPVFGLFRVWIYCQRSPFDKVYVLSLKKWTSFQILRLSEKVSQNLKYPAYFNDDDYLATWLVEVIEGYNAAESKRQWGQK